MNLPATRIERVRLHADALDAGQARLRLSSLLGRAELRPRGLPPTAVLCVRRVADPLPGTLVLETGDARPPPEWERAFVESLERKLRGAARPAREAVPAAAEAVLFADWAELLACLARDARDGRAWLRWWWRDLRLWRTDGSDPVVSAWLDKPEHVPAALELLAARREAAPFVATLRERDAAALVLRVAAVHGLAELRRVIAAWAQPPAADPTDVVEGEPPVAEPPWAEVVPESSERPLAPELQLLLGVALTLRRAPHVARSPHFAAATETWRAAASPSTRVGRPRLTEVPDLSEAVSPTGEAEPQRAPEPTTVDRKVEHSTDSTAPSPATEADAVPAPPVAVEGQVAERAPTEHVVVPIERTSDVEPAAPAPDATATPPPGRTAKPAPAIEEHHRPSPAFVPEVPARRKRAQRARRPQPDEPSFYPEPEIEPVTAAVETELGGVFYLLNLALFLELYPDFSRPLDPGLDLDPWDLLALLAPRLLDTPSRDDPLWRLLARLAGRKPRERPGRGFRPPSAWRTPPQWLAPFEQEGTWRWSAARKTLRVVHPAGFQVVAVPLKAAHAEAQLARELRRLPMEPELRRASLPAEPSQPLARWTARLAAYADARLRRALALNPKDSLDEVLLRRRARVLVTPSHVDVAFRLADLPFEVRLAGLDRTPGWIPATGRYVAFHFE